jgi:hypothetical protein
MGDKADSKQAAQADLELKEKEAEEVKGGRIYGMEGKKRKRKKHGALGGGGSANAKPQ